MSIWKAKECNGRLDMENPFKYGKTSGCLLNQVFNLKHLVVSGIKMGWCMSSSMNKKKKAWNQNLHYEMFATKEAAIVNSKPLSRVGSPNRLVWHYEKKCVNS